MIPVALFTIYFARRIIGILTGPTEIRVTPEYNNQSNRGVSGPSRAKAAAASGEMSAVMGSRNLMNPDQFNETAPVMYDVTFNTSKTLHEKLAVQAAAHGKSINSRIIELLSETAGHTRCSIFPSVCKYA
jgi:hypothetical protein